MSSKNTTEPALASLGTPAVFQQSHRRWRRLIRNYSALASVLFLTAVLVFAAQPQLLTREDPYAIQSDSSENPSLVPPSPTHPMGTDELGRDIFVRVLYGARTSLLAGAVVVAAVGTLGTGIGMLSASSRGTLDDVVMRVADMFLSFPPLVVAIVALGFLGPGLHNGLLALSLVWWPQYARLARGSTLSALQSEYVTAAQAVGAKKSRILVRHVLPNMISPILVKGSLDLGQVILIAGALSFLGLGVQPPTPELGALVTQGREYLLTAWWYSTFPGMLIFLIVLALNFVGDGLREVLDPTTAT
jgi:peptide/nickel transport system permease protein